MPISEHAKRTLGRPLPHDGAASSVRWAADDDGPALASMGRPEPVNWLTEDGTIPDSLPEPRLFRVLIMPLRAQEKTAGGVILSDESKQAHDYSCYIGQILKLGPMAFTGNFGGDDIPKVGDTVVYAKHVPVRMERLDGFKLVLMDDAHVLAKVENPHEYRIYA